MERLVGYYGKIPSRGDFVGHGLDAATRDAMDAWCQDVLPASQDCLGPAWRPAWMEAPIWRFRLPPGPFGPRATAGIWLPSTDRAGRLFPLLLVVAGYLDGCGALLDRLEQIGLDAVEHDLAPENIAGLLAAAAGSTDIAPLQAVEGEWWTQGGPRVLAARRHMLGLPDGTVFSTMLSDEGHYTNC